MVRTARLEEVVAVGRSAQLCALCSGECEIFLCENAQGGRGKGTVEMTFGEEGSETADEGVWMSIWVDDADEVHRHCVANGFEVTWPPTDMPWNAGEMRPAPMDMSFASDR